MIESPVVPILRSLHLSAEEIGNLAVDTEVLTLVAAAFFRVSENGLAEGEPANLLDELGDFVEVLRVLPEPPNRGAVFGSLQDYLLVALVPTSAFGEFEAMFRRPGIDRVSMGVYEDRRRLAALLSGVASAGPRFEELGPEALLDRARSFILSPGEFEKMTQPEKSKEVSFEHHKTAVTGPIGFLAAGVRCGIKTEGPDLAILLSDRPANVAARSSKNKFCSPPVRLNREQLAKGDVRAVVANSGNANAATGSRGMADAKRMAELAAEKLGLQPHQVLVCSTGIIGEFLPMEKIEAGIAEAATTLVRGRDDLLIQGIMTTDTVPKSSFREFDLGGTIVRIGGVTKGSGMIHPNLATMFAFLTTDAAVEAEALDQALGQAVDRSFNCLSVDGDMSTSDTVLLFANGAAGNEPLTEDSDLYPLFVDKIQEVCVDLVEQLALDGEGATHLVRVICQGAATREDAHEVANSIGTSLLVKTAIFGRDPNWGRIVMAIGKTSARFTPENVRIWMVGHLVFEKGLAVDFPKSTLQKDMAAKEIEIRVHLGEGEAEPVTVYTCDLSYDYVRINAEYHT
jgi:glutamate N-acetyltransferase/amino-acid N-acetyltransferase